MYKKTLYTFVLKVIGLLVAFGFQIILGRLLPQDSYGKYTIFVTYINILSVFSVIGMDNNLIRVVAKEDTSSRSYLYFAVKIVFIISLISSFVVLILGKILDFDFLTMALFPILLVMFSIHKILDGYLQGKGKIITVTFLSVFLNNILKIVFFIILLQFINNLYYSAIISYMLSELLTFLYRLMILEYSKINMILPNEKKSEFISYSLQFALLIGIITLMSNMDKILIDLFLNNKMLAIYNVSLNYVQILAVFISPFIVFWPKISYYYNLGELKSIEKHMRLIVLIIINLTIPMFFIIIHKSEVLLSLFGSSYVTKEGKLVLIILSTAILFDCISGPIGSILNMTKYVKTSLYINIFTLILNIVISTLLLFKYGIIGVAIGTAMSIVTRNFISIVYVKRKMMIFSYDSKFLLYFTWILSTSLIVSYLFNQIDFFSNKYLNLLSFLLIIYSAVFIIEIVLHWKIIKIYIGKYKFLNSRIRK